MNWWPELHGPEVAPPARVRIMFVRKGETAPQFGVYGVERSRKFLGNRVNLAAISFLDPIKLPMYATVFSPVVESEIPTTLYGEVYGQEQFPWADVRLWCLAPEIPL